MPEDTIPCLQAAIRKFHGCDSVFEESGPAVVLMHINSPNMSVHGWRAVWEGTVHVFNLAGHPTARRAYAWAIPTASSPRSYRVVLHGGEVDSPQKAVDAAYGADMRDRRWRDWEVGTEPPEVGWTAW